MSTEKRKRVVRMTIDFEVEARGPEESDQYFFEEHWCHLNLLDVLADYRAKDDAKSVCSVEQFSKVELLPVGAKGWSGTDL